MPEQHSELILQNIYNSLCKSQNRQERKGTSRQVPAVNASLRPAMWLLPEQLQESQYQYIPMPDDVVKTTVAQDEYTPIQIPVLETCPEHI